MLSYFPTPYPDELWYSVLCRYHIRSGNRKSTTTFRELFNGKDTARLSTFLPNNTIRIICSQLPNEILDEEDIVMNHTLCKYILRFKTENERSIALNSIRDGNYSVGSYGNHMGNQSLKTCPICTEEDIKKLGEPYWHLRHQIPGVRICHIHGCDLIIHEDLRGSRINNNFILPGINEGTDKRHTIDRMELELTKILTSYLDLPIELGATQGHNNLYASLVNGRYGIVRQGSKQSLDYKLLEEDLWKCFGKQHVQKYFGIMSSASLRQIRDWKCKVPERYAILSMLVGLTAEKMFQAEPIENELTRQFLELSKSGIIRSKKYVAKRLGVLEPRLDDIAKTLEVKPFWEQSANKCQPRKTKRYIGFTEAEWAYIHLCTEKYGFQSPSAFVRYCVNSIKSNEKTLLPES